MGLLIVCPQISYHTILPDVTDIRFCNLQFPIIVGNIVDQFIYRLLTYIQKLSTNKNIIYRNSISNSSKVTSLI